MPITSHANSITLRTILLPKTATGCPGPNVTRTDEPPPYGLPRILCGWGGINYDVFMVRSCIIQYLYRVRIGQSGI